MNEMKRSQAFLRKRKMMLVLPVLVIPFCTMAFWALGGGKQTEVKEQTTASKGLNLQLPDAHFKDELQDKLSFYEKADKDSVKMAELMRNDPYYKQQQGDSLVNGEVEIMGEELAAKHGQLITSPYQSSKDPKIEEKVMTRINDLQREMAKNEMPTVDSPVRASRLPQKQNPEFSAQVDRLEQMLGAINTPGEADPEMQQVENALDKILDIQHPERVKEKLKNQSLQHKEVVYPVQVKDQQMTIGILDSIPHADKSAASFFDIVSNIEDYPISTSVAAVIPEPQMLVSGSVIKFRLCDDIYVNGVLIPKDNLVFGVASLNDERLQIEITSIRYRQNIFPVKLEVYDLDGLAGIYIPGAISREVAKQSTDNSLQAIEMTTMDPSLKAQAAAAGIGAAKSLISKKVKLIRVTVKAGYKVLLRDKQSNY